jgi:hypothetical protein
MSGRSAFRKSFLALIALVAALELSGAAWAAAEVWVFGHVDPKWGSPMHNFEFAFGLIQLVVAGAILSFALVALGCQRRISRSSSSRIVLAGLAAGLSICVAWNTGAITAVGMFLPDVDIFSILFMALVPATLICLAAVLVATHGQKTVAGVA